MSKRLTAPAPKDLSSFSAGHRDRLRGASSNSPGSGRAGWSGLGRR
jgi:hypothetical protein